ncbi:hypothetical protein [Mesomycoplasma lagogenitalium]|uniref:Uncharacterized protein n=1 Tax=Mesomycoplasma lagogenitalium TaxID=171286 RepID=A0ABY8LSR4_9BACT|nr:hypothetical protein [Mesomycoplasma lagogenitalium]WGI36304.1 hypothetical protein QEG99_02390 [Mesomycoplasma lagogenitalium]
MKKQNKKIFLISSLLAILLIGGGITTGLLLTNKKHNNQLVAPKNETGKSDDESGLNNDENKNNINKGEVNKKTDPSFNSSNQNDQLEKGDNFPKLENPSDKLKEDEKKETDNSPEINQPKISSDNPNKDNLNNLNANNDLQSGQENINNHQGSDENYDNNSNEETDNLNNLNQENSLNQGDNSNNLNDNSNSQNDTENINSSDESQENSSNANLSDNFVAQSVEIIKLTDEMATIKIAFSQYQLANNNIKDFQLSYTHNLTKKMFSESLPYNINDNYVIFNIENLDFSENYKIQELFLNNKKISLENVVKQGNNWINTNDNSLEFTTKVYQNKITYDSIFTEIDNNGNVLSLSLENVQGLFKMSENQYFSFIKLKDLSNNKEFYYQPFIKKENDGLKNIELNINDSSAPEEFYNNNLDPDDPNYTLYELPANANFEILEFRIDKEGKSNVDVPRVLVTPKDNVNKTFNTNLNSDLYKNNVIEYDNNLKTLTVKTVISKSESSSEFNQVKFYLSSNFGGQWILAANKINDQWVAQINNLKLDGKIYIEKVTGDDQIIKLDKINKGTTEINYKQIIKKPTINNVSLEIDSNNNNYSIINVEFNDENNQLENYKLSDPVLEIKKENDDSIIKPAFIEKRDKIYKFKIYLEPNSNYLINYFALNNEQFNYDRTFSRNTNNNGTKTVDQLNQLIDSINQNINLTKRFWASQAKKTLVDKSNLMNYTNLSSLINIDDSIDLNISYLNNNNNSERDGILSFELKLISNGNQSKTRVLNFSNLYNVNYLRNLSEDPSFYADLIKISKAGHTKSTLDFDKIFTEIDKNDLTYSFGTPTTWINLKDERLNEFLDIDPAFRNYDESQLKIYFVKYRDVRNLYEPHQTTSNVMLGFMNYRINYWFDNLNNSKTEAKYKNFSTPIFLGGFNDYNDSNSKDLFKVYQNLIVNYSKEQWKNFNTFFGLNTDLSLDQIIYNINQITNNNEKWQYLTSISKIKNLFNSIDDIVKNSYDPTIRTSNFKIEIINVEKEQIGLNNFLNIEFIIKINVNSTKFPNYSENNIVNNQSLKIKFLKN